jgi:hypothetical protein
VDIRLRREVRAPGFRADALETLLGRRYVWMPDLGNVAALENNGDIRIRRPQAADELLELILTGPERRVIFFCACEIAGHCHRRTVSQLLVQAAERQRTPLVVVEWPGGEPETLVLPATPPQLLGAARNEIGRIPIPGSMSHAAAVTVPWGSAALLRHQQHQAFALVGPARFGTHGAYLPVFHADSCEQTLRAEARGWLAKHGLTALSSTGDSGSR